MAVSNGGSAIAVHGDVTSDADMEAAVATAETEFGRLDVAFNNAGVMLDGDTDAVATSEGVVDRTLSVNVKGVLNGCKHQIPAMQRSGGGSIINTASFVASVGAATPQIAYTASKGAVLAMTREPAVIHAREGGQGQCPLPRAVAHRASDGLPRHRREGGDVVWSTFRWGGLARPRRWPPRRHFSHPTTLRFLHDRRRPSGRRWPDVRLCNPRVEVLVADRIDVDHVVPDRAGARPVTRLEALCDNGEPS